MAADRCLYGGISSRLPGSSMALSEILDHIINLAKRTALRSAESSNPAS